jgi:hypothetical protein
MPIHFNIIRDGSLFSARGDDDGIKFEVGRQVHFHQNIGLANDNSTLGKQFNYDAENFETAFPFWANFIAPTAACEGQSFITLNTYDRARFTFGFTQFAAHVPNGDFVRWMRTMLQHPSAGDYFPDLALVNGRIVKVGQQNTVPLESDDSTEPLMDYLNPSLSVVDDDEVIAAAKFIHWTMKHPETQDLQVRQMVATGHALLSEADKRIGLDGVSGDLCCVVMDIRHQGRGKFAEMLQALKATDPYKALLSIGSIPFPERVKTLKKLIEPQREAFAQRHWNRQQQELV